MIKEYYFYGNESPVVSPVVKGFPSIRSQRDMYDALTKCWIADTCAPRMRDEWSCDDKTKGQCSITAFLVQDLFGGDVYGIPLGDGNVHCYNVVGDSIFDLTSEQFGDKAASLVYENNPLQDREKHFAKEENLRDVFVILGAEALKEKKARYELLKNRLIENEKLTFLRSNDFLKLGTAVNDKNWDIVMMTVRRMEQKAQELGMDDMARRLKQVKIAAQSRNREQGLASIAQISSRRAQFINEKSKGM